MALRHKNLFLLPALALAACLCLLGREGFSYAPFAGTYWLSAPSEAFGGEGGRLYVIDAGQTRLLFVDGSGTLLSCARAGENTYFSQVTGDGGTGAYAAQTVYAGRGTVVAAERIVHFDGRGRALETVYEQQYGGGDAPRQYGRIQSMSVSEGKLMVVAADAGGIALLRVAEGSATVSRFTPGPGRAVSHAVWDQAKSRMIAVTRSGEILSLDEGGGRETLLASGAGRTPWRVAVLGERVYYTDLADASLYRLGASGPERIYQGDSALYTVNRASERLLLCDHERIIALEGEAPAVLDGFPLAGRALYAAAWCAAGVLASAALAGSLLMARRLARRRGPMLGKVAAIIASALMVGTLTSYLAVDAMLTNQKDAMIKDMSLFASLLSRQFTRAELDQIQTAADYRNAAYTGIKSRLDPMVNTAYENGRYYYYILYSGDETGVYGVMDYEDTMTARHPFYARASEYGQVLDTGAWQVHAQDVSSYGAWAFVLCPVKDAAGNTFAIMEVGQNLDQLTQAWRSLVAGILMTAFSAVVVLVMLLIEAVFCAAHFGGARALGGAGISARFPLRTLAFLTYFADCMQDAFIVILLSKLYKPLLGIPQELGAALPMTAQLLASALFALTGGRILGKLGPRRALALGFMLQAAGFLVCACWLNYTGLTAGKALIGMGGGLVMVTVNAIAAMDGEAQSARTYAQINAGVLAGVTAGVGIGSIVLTVFREAAVFALGALAAALGIAAVLACRDCAPAGLRKPALRPRAFFANRGAMVFFLLVLTPFLIALSFREYFFPLYAQSMGLSEADIGHIYLVCGLMVIYLGPVLSRYALGKVGVRGAVIAASLMMALSMLLFAALPSLVSALLGLALLSAAISFGYAAQNTYYTSLPVVKSGGEAAAMGVYSLFDSGGQTLGPMVFGALMLLGAQAGLMLAGGALLTLTALFAFCGKEGKRYVRVQPDDAG